MGEFRESSLVLWDSEDIIDYQIGNSCSVEFDFEKVWGFWGKRDKRNNCTCPLFDFYHVHPVGCESYSTIDENCMKGFTQAFGASPYFHIVIFRNDNIYDLDHKLFSYVYSLQENRVIKVIDSLVAIDFMVFEPIDIDYRILLILKLLSYGRDLNSFEKVKSIC